MATINQEKYDIVFDGLNTSVEMLERIKYEIESDNVDKEYLLTELSRLQSLLANTEREFNSGYCLDPSEKQYNDNKMAEKIASIDEEIEKNGLSL